MTTKIEMRDAFPVGMAFMPSISCYNFRILESGACSDSCNSFSGANTRSANLIVTIR
jgi:hypothetical protein